MSIGYEQLFQKALLLPIQQLRDISVGRVKSALPLAVVQAAMEVKAPMYKSAMAQQAMQQPKQPTVRDQMLRETAPPEPMMSGIAAADAGGLMTPKAMAAGGIVAFEEGGFVMPSKNDPMYDQVIEGFRQAAPSILAKARRREPLAPNEMQVIKVLQDAGRLPFDAQSFFTAESRVPSGLQKKLTPPTTPLAQTPPPLAAAGPTPSPPPSPPAPPPGAAPSGFGGSSLAGFPAVGPSLKAAQTAITARGDYDPMQTIRTFDPTPYNAMLPMTPEQIRKEMGKGRTQLNEMFPEKTREEIEQRLAQRYAGLEEMYKQREARAGEARKEAETEKGRTAGIGLLQLASELVTKPLAKIDTSAALQTFKDANTDFRKAQKEYREGLDKIAEARELQKIGQAEKADDLFRQGALARFNFETTINNAAIGQDAIRKTGILSLADKATRAQADKLDAAVKGAELGLSTSVEGAKLGSEERRTAMTANAYGQRYTTPGYLQNLAQDNAAKLLEVLLKADPLLQTKLMKDTSLAIQLQNQLYNEELAKLQGTAAPSGGGAVRPGFTVEKISN